MSMPDLVYQSGFGNYFSSEALPESLPIGRNSPQKAPRGLYAEQLSGAAFTVPNAENLRTWVYRILPSVKRSAHKPLAHPTLRSGPFDEVPPNPDQLRWDPLPMPTKATDFVDGMVTVCGNGDPSVREGSAVHLYAANSAMRDRAFVNADGDFLIVPQLGGLEITTELGRMRVDPQEIALIPRGMPFRVDFRDASVAGYVLENYGEHFVLPYRGPIGANGLANQRDFLTPVAWFEEVTRTTQILVKFQGALFSATQDHSPFDVVAWHGNYAPCKYDLRHFNTINTVSFDHPDPSIFTVLTSPGVRAGTANVDFVIFPPRWMVAEDTFRPPYYHRNIMSEYMGLIHGVYDAKPSGGFVPGGASLHNAMAAHGPDAGAFAAASEATLKPHYLADTMAFMFESSRVYRPTAWAMATETRQRDYLECWASLRSHFRR